MGLHQEHTRKLKFPHVYGAPRVKNNQEDRGGRAGGWGRVLFKVK